MRAPAQSLPHRSVRQGSHDLVAGGIGVQAVFGEVFLQRPLVIDPGAEVVEVEAAMVGAVGLQPAIESAAGRLSAVVEFPSFWQLH